MGIFFLLGVCIAIPWAIYRIAREMKKNEKCLAEMDALLENYPITDSPQEAQLLRRRLTAIMEKMNHVYKLDMDKARDKIASIV
jgi:hypothetical protein